MVERDIEHVERSLERYFWNTPYDRAMMRKTLTGIAGLRQHSAAETQRINDPKYGKYLVPSDRVIGGVCGGLAHTLGVDPVVVRVITAVLAILGGWATTELSWRVVFVGEVLLVLVILAMIIGVATLSIPYAVSGTALTALFATKVRYTGVAITSNTAGVISGFIPLFATALAVASHGGRTRTRRAV